MGEARSLTLRFTTPALGDLAMILDHVAAHSPQGAKSIQRRIQKILELLAEHPKIGTTCDDPIIRRITTPPYPYLIFYEATETEVIIHAVRHSARDPEGMPGSGRN